MPKLAHIASAMNSNKVDGIVAAIGDYIASTIADKLAGDMARGSDGLTSIKGAVAAIEPAVRSALDSVVAEVRQHLTVHQSAMKAELKTSTDKLTGTQQALMKALTTIRFPDHSDALMRIEAKETDLAPLEKKLEAVLLKMDMKDDDDPKEWKFTVKRNSRGFIETVTATAED